MLHNFGIQCADFFFKPLFANVALTVGPDIDYVKVKMTAGNNEGEVYYLAAAAADRVLGEGNYEVLAEMKGKELEFDEYERLIPGAELNKNLRGLCNDRRRYRYSTHRACFR